MGLNRSNPEYGPIDVLLGDDLKEVLDRTADAAAVLASVRKGLNKVAGKMSHGEQTLLNIAWWFWNGDGIIDYHGVINLGPGNRKRFTEAMAVFLGVS